ncbi:MAG TPA: heterodisulfide reductase-related iron-sulfur binding cluster, partial [Terriglobales bacterium]|nr:heterodisulfide reductase-related iron-sulfur binding cluster [Terriglobales bacterium]
QVPKEDFTGKRLYEVMDLCLECKGCKAECPSNVDMAKLKYEFLDHYHQANGLPLRHRLFGGIERLNRLGCLFAPLSNAFVRSPLTRWLMELVGGVDRRRPLPEFAGTTFRDWFSMHEARGDGTRGEVVLFDDTFNNFNTPDVAIAAVCLLEQMDYRIILANKRCCGRPMISKGLLAQAKNNAAWNVEQLAGYAERGVSIIGLEPSCLLTLRDEYPEFVRTPEAKNVAANSFLLEEFLLRERDSGELTAAFQGESGKALLHGHCHQKALVGTVATVAALEWAGFDVSEVDSGCCGMAGSFGFEREHYDLSVVIGNRRLAPAVKAAGADVAIVAPGISCRQQIDHLTGRKAMHPAELLWERLIK